MRIQKQTSSQLILTGIPGSLFWMLALTFFGLLIMTATSLMGWYLWQESNMKLALLPLSIGTLVGAGFLWIGVMQLKSSEHLVLDKNNRTGIYVSTSPIVVTEKTCRFQWKDIESIEITRPEASTVGNLSTGHQPEPSQLSMAVLKTIRPRQSIILDETQNGNLDRVKTIANSTAAFLEIELTNKRS
jgi:hypothetical protein